MEQSEIENLLTDQLKKKYNHTLGFSIVSGVFLLIIIGNEYYKYLTTGLEFKPFNIPLFLVVIALIISLGRVKKLKSEIRMRG